MEDKEKRMAASIFSASMVVFTVLIAIIFMLLAMSSCKTVYVPVESVRTEYRDRLLHDSICLKDSIYIRERDDTVFVDKWHTTYIERLRVDSIHVADTVPVPYRDVVEVKVEKELSWGNARRWTSVD
jgi:hypothetical protein